MDLELVKFINSDLTWNAVKKGHRSMVRRPRRPATSSSKFGSGIKMQDSVSFDYEKSGVAILGQHFAEEVLDVPIKKRIRMLQSPSLSNERARSTQPQSPSPQHEESELPVGSKQVCHSMKSNGTTNSEHSKVIEKEVPDLNDFSGIELLAAAACHSSVYDSPAPMESSAVEEHTTQRVESHTDGVKEDIAPIDSDDSSVQDSVFPVTQNICDNGNGDGDKGPVPSKDVRLHWDLNTVMDEWEEPCCDILVDPHSEKAYLKDDLQNAKTNLEGYETTNSQVTGSDHELVKSDAIDKSDGRQAVSEVVQGGCQDDKVTSDDRLSDCCGSNTIDKVKAGYESPVEDGELRDTWQKDEVEEMECVDYESDNLYEDNFDTIESVNNEVIGVLGAVVPNNIEQDDRKNVPSISNQLPEHSQSAISEEKNRIPSFGVRKNDACISRSRSENIEDSYSRGKRDFGPENFMGRDGPSYKGRARNDSSRWDDSSMGGWDSRNSPRYPRPQHVIRGSSVRDTQPINYIPRDSYKTFNTRPSPSHKNESFGIHRETQRGISRDRFKGGSGFHLQGSRREEYNGPDPCHSERKVSSFSPNLNRGAHISRSRRRSRSRSRSESPIAWNFQKKRNVDTKRQSPESKADTRFQVERYNINDQYRDRRASPVRTGGYNLGRVRSSDHFYPTSRSGRYPPHADSQYDDKFGMMNGGGRFRYHADDSFRTRNKDNGFRYTRNENRYFKDPVGERDFHKDDLQRE